MPRRVHWLLDPGHFRHSYVHSACGPTVDRLVAVTTITVVAVPVGFVGGITVTLVSLSMLDITARSPSNSTALVSVKPLPIMSTGFPPACLLGFNAVIVGPACCADA